MLGFLNNVMFLHFPVDKNHNESSFHLAWRTETVEVSSTLLQQ